MDVDRVIEIAKNFVGNKTEIENLGDKLSAIERAAQNMRLVMLHPEVDEARIKARWSELMAAIDGLKEF